MSSDPLTAERRARIRHILAGNGSVSVSACKALLEALEAAESERDALKERFQPYETICLVCGANEACVTDPDAFSACTFDTTYDGLVQMLHERDDRIRELMALEEAAKRLVWRLNKAGDSPASKWFDSLTEYAALRDVALKGKGDKEE